jgi:membrane protein implicated in regulation of membrane protease activity
MLSIYIACLIFGGLLLAASFFMGSGHDVDAHDSLDIHTDTDFHSALEGGGNIDTHAEITHSDDFGSHSIDNQQHGENPGDAVKFISFRNIIFFLSFFGLTGTALSMINISGIITLVSAIFIGFFSAITGYRFMKYLKSSESGEAINIYSLQGKTGKVILNLTKEKQGKILIEAGAHSIEIRSILSENSTEDELKNGDKIIIIDIKDNLATVIKSDL